MSISKVKYLGESFIPSRFVLVISILLFFFSHLITLKKLRVFFIFIFMENNLKLKIIDYFSFPPNERDKIIEDLTQFYFDRNVSIRNVDEFEKSIGQLIFTLRLEYKFALQTENYNRVEIYEKLTNIFSRIRDKFLDDHGL